MAFSIRLFICLSRFRCGRRQEQPENHVYIVGKAHPALLMETYKVYHHVCFVVAYGDGYVALVYYAERHCGVGCARAYLLDVWYTQDYKHPSVVVLIAGTLVGIADVRKEIIGYLELVFQHLPVFFRGTCYLYPAVGLPFADSVQPIVCVPICSHKFAFPYVSRCKERPFTTAYPCAYKFKFSA